MTVGDGSRLREWRRMCRRLFFNTVVIMNRDTLTKVTGICNRFNRDSQDGIRH